MKAIPNSITNLVNLQMLNLLYCWNLKELPEGIGKLISLRHLVIDGCKKISHMPRGLEKLTSLRTLSRFIVGADERRSIGIGALKDLNNLRESLSIEKLEKVRDARSESKAANLMGKQYLRHLSLKWYNIIHNGVEEFAVKDKSGDDAEILLEGLQPHPNLRNLGIYGYSGARLPSWMMGNIGISFPNMVDIFFSNCTNIRQLPPTLYQLPCLKSLALRNLPKVESSSSSSSSSSPPSFPCLTSLSIEQCPMLTSMPLAPLLETLKLDGVSEKLVCQQLSSSTLSRLNSLVKISLLTPFPPFYQLPCLQRLYLENLPKVEEYGGNGDGSSSSSSSPSFPCLTFLGIHYCPMLTSMPLASLLETLELRSVSEKLLCQQLSSSPLSRLSSLSISCIEDIEALPEEDVLRNLTSLKALFIERCPRLLRLAEIQHLTALEDLTIRYCEELDLSADGMNWQALSSLHELLIQDLPKLVSLPEGLQHVTTLQGIHISGCRGLVALPEWMSNLTSLEGLDISGCPLLWKRCKKDAGEDWPNIAHIPNITIDREVVDWSKRWSR